VGVEERMSVASLRDARDASTAHLEAVLKIDGASYLRLAHLRDQLDFSDQVDLKAGAGVQPQLWLDLAHRMTMEPDAKTYRLSYHGVDRIEVLLETTNLAEAKAAAEKVLAIRVVGQARLSVQAAQKAEWRWLTLLYVWMTGVVTGFAALALYVIIMKKLPF
jgi:soluble cytochrome b562